MKADWVAKAALYELLAKTFQQTTREFSDFVRSGEYAETLVEVAGACGLDGGEVERAEAALHNAGYGQRDGEELFHELRRSYTRLFIGGAKPLVSPYAGVWWAQKQGIDALLMVNAESLAVERFMRECGVASKSQASEPVDTIGAELEFMQYLCAVAAVEGDSEAALATLPAMEALDRYREFNQDHFWWFAHELALAVVERGGCPLYEAAAIVLAAFPESGL